MKMEIEELEQLAKEYAETNEATKHSHSSAHVAFTILNETKEMTDAHDGEDLQALMDLLQKLGIGTEKELQKIFWSKLIPKGMERPVVLMTTSKQHIPWYLSEKTGMA